MNSAAGFNDFEKLASDIYGMFQGREPSSDLLSSWSAFSQSPITSMWHCIPSGNREYLLNTFTRNFKSVNERTGFTRQWAGGFTEGGNPKSEAIAFEFVKEALSTWFSNSSAFQDVVAINIDVHAGSFADFGMQYPLPFDYFAFYNCKEGEAVLQHRGETMLIEGGDFLLIPPMYACTVTRSSESLSYTWGYFRTNSSWNELLRTLGALVVPAIFQLERQHAWRVGDNLSEISSMLGMKGPRVARMSSLLMETVLSRLTLASPEGRDDQRVSRVINHVLSNIEREVPVSELASLVSVSPSRLYAVFKDQVGESLHKWQLSVRLGKAAELLRVTTLSVAEVAFQTGFHDQKYFSRVFKIKFGKTPSQIRFAGDLKLQESKILGN